MIFVTVGTNNMGFERLIKKMDEIASKIDEEVIMQIGYTDYEPKNTQWGFFLKYEQMNSFYKKASIIISHAGQGTLLDILNLEKPCIIVPRQKQYGEHVDDQQMELAKALQKHKNVITVYDIFDLEKEMRKASKLKYNEKNSKSLIKFLKNSI